MVQVTEYEKLVQQVRKSALELAEKLDPSKFPGKHLVKPLKFSKHPWFKNSSKYLAFESAHERIEAHLELLEKLRAARPIPEEE